MSFRLPRPIDPGYFSGLESNLTWDPTSAGRRVPPAPGADEQAGWPEGEEPDGLEGRGWPGGRLDDYEEAGDGR